MGDAVRQGFYGAEHECAHADAAGSHGCHRIERGPGQGQGYAIKGRQMTRWVMVADLQRCVGCQTCTAACKQANATSPSITTSASAAPIAPLPAPIRHDSRSTRPALPMAGPPCKTKWCATTRIA